MSQGYWARLSERAFRVGVACSRLSVVGDGEKGRAREKNEGGLRLSVVGDGEKGRAREKNEGGLRRGREGESL